MSVIEVGTLVVARLKSRAATPLDPIDPIMKSAIDDVCVVVGIESDAHGKRAKLKRLHGKGGCSPVAFARLGATRFKSHGPDYRIVDPDEDITAIMSALDERERERERERRWTASSGPRYCSECGQPLLAAPCYDTGSSAQATIP